MVNYGRVIWVFWVLVCTGVITGRLVDRIPGTTGASDRFLGGGIYTIGARSRLTLRFMVACIILKNVEIGPVITSGLLGDCAAGKGIYADHIHRVILYALLREVQNHEDNHNVVASKEIHFGDVDELQRK